MGSQESTSRSQHSVLSVIPLFSVVRLSSQRHIMSDDEEYDSEEEEEDSEGDEKGPKNELEAKVVLTGEALEKKLKIWIGEWRDVRAKEDDVLKKLKEKQEKRRVIRA